MSAIEKITAWQKRTRLDDISAAKWLGISELLYFKLLNGEVTHPKIAVGIQKAVGLSDLETEELMPLNHRKSGGSYEPDKYVSRGDSKRFVIPTKDFPIDKSMREV